MTEDNPHILVVDDDTRLRELLRKYLMEQGFRVTTAEEASDARQRMESLSFDLIVLDIMMPGESGLDLTRSLRTSSSVPILLLTAMGESSDRIDGLESGADDYLTKPFEPRELVLRIRSILRRIQSERGAAAQQISFGEFSFDPARDQLRRGEEFVHLTTAELTLLKTLADKPGQPVSREDLANEANLASSARTIDVQVNRLRRKIEANPKYPRYLQTVRGTGYILIPD